MKNLRNLLRIGFLSFLVGGCCVGVHDSAVVRTPDADLISDAGMNRKLAIERLRQVTVAIIMNDSVIKLPTCTGVWIGKDLIITAAHCVDEDKLVFEYATKDEYDNEKSSKATLVARDSKSDLALLLAPGSAPHPIATFSRDLISPGDPVDVMGHPVGYDWTYSKGYVSSIRKNHSGPKGIMERTIQISSPIWMGSSGGGAFDSRGNLLGICSWISKSGPHLSFFIHRDVVEAFVIKNLAKI